MNLRNFNSSIIGLSILAEKQHLLVGSKNGDFEVWDPRMYQVGNFVIVFIYDFFRFKN